MKLRIFSFVISIPFFVSVTVTAAPPPDEGMWLLTLISRYNYETMRELGCQVTPGQIYSEQQPSIKDAIVSLGDFCTAEFVSDDGLLFTNHHCGYDAIAEHSTVENNLLEKGFWSANRGQELSNPGLFVKVLVRMQDVSDSIIPVVASLGPEDRQKKVQELTKTIATHAAEDGKYKAEVKPMFYGNQYFLFIYQVFNDVRLVAAPPVAIGKFGGDTDNWMWPRHTGDFSVFRVYADKQNNPTSGYDAGNVPYHPKYVLPVSLKGINEGDYEMILGYPGSTERYLTSYAISDVINEMNPAMVSLFRPITDVMKKDMDADPDVKIKLASDYASLMNSLKLYESQLPDLKRMDLLHKKQVQEKEFQVWADQQGVETKKRYATMFDDFKKQYDALQQVELPFFYAIYNVVLMPSGNFALDVNDLESVLTKDASAEARQKTIDDIKKSAAEYFAKMEPQTEKKVMVAMLTSYAKDRPATELPDPVKHILSSYKGKTPEEKFRAFADEAFEKSFLVSSSKFNSFIKKPTLKALAKDPLYNYYMGLYAKGLEYRAGYRQVNGEINKNMRLYLQGLMEKDPEAKLYPDANFTMRLTYGTVEPYHARDAVHYGWATTLSGIMEKEDDSSDEFKVPDKLNELYNQHDFGRYGGKESMPVCFITTNDITGGNSGSPVLNANGELTGLAFDGNYEGTAGDYEIDPAMNRTICVDIRYVLFIIDKFAGAQNLVSELKIVQ